MLTGANDVNFEILFHQSPQPMIIYDINTLMILEVNKAAHDFYGYSKEEFFAMNVRELRSEADLAKFDTLAPLIKENGSIQVEGIHVVKSGELRNVEIGSYIINYRNVKSRLVHVHDITEKVEYARKLEIMVDLGKSISESLDLQTIVQKVTDSTTRLTGAEFGAFFYNTVNSEGESYMLYTLSGAPREAFEKFGMPRNTPLFNHTFTGQGILRVDDIRKHPLFGKNPPHSGMPAGHLPVVSFMSIPVISKSGNVIGGLFFGHSKPGVFTKEAENFVAGATAHASFAIDNAQLYREVKEISAKKDEFLSIASHELKTPLTSVKAYIQLLERTDLDVKPKMFIEKSLKQLGRLERLTSDLLDVSKISAGKLTYDKVVFNFGDLIKESVENVQHSISSHTIQIKNAVSINFTGDRFRLEQVINNFLSNAIKYSPGANTIIVDSYLQENHIVVSIQDFGIGIEKENLSKIFHRFYRVDHTAMKYEGLGLGLYIASEVLIRHNGDFWIESEPGKGSVAFFRIPVTIDSLPKASIDNSVAYSSDFITITYNEALKLIETDWKGFQTFDTVKAGCLKMLEILKSNKCSLVLNDNSNISGASDAAEWVGKEWFPMMEEAGLKCFAWVYSPVIFNNISAEKAVDMKVGNVIAQFFTTVDDAKNWLLHYRM